MGLIVALDDNYRAAGELFWDDGDSRGIVAFLNLCLFCGCVCARVREWVWDGISCILLLPLITGIPFMSFKQKLSTCQTQRITWVIVIVQTASVSSHTVYGSHASTCDCVPGVKPRWQSLTSTFPSFFFLVTETVKTGNYIHYTFSVVNVSFPHICTIFQILHTYSFWSEFKFEVQNLQRPSTSSVQNSTSMIDPCYAAEALLDQVPHVPASHSPEDCLACLMHASDVLPVY